MHRYFVKFALGILLALCLVTGPGCRAKIRGTTNAAASAGKTGTFADEQMTIAGKKRQYRLVVPSSVKSDQPVPLAFAFHGFGDSKDLMSFYSGLDDLAKKHGFILVYPNARNKTWPLVVDWAKEDLDFFDSLYTLLTTSYSIDTNRVYLTGMSNGAYFCNVVASQRSDKVAAIAPHSGGLGLLPFQKEAIPYKYPVLIIHGADDSIVSIDEARKMRDFYQNAGHEVQYNEIPNHHHLWAGHVRINDTIWQFFENHPHR